MRCKLLLLMVLMSGGILLSHVFAEAPTKEPVKEMVQVEKIMKTKEEWKQILSTDQFHVMREKGTERAFTGKYWDHKEKGVYTCAGCGLDLFDSDTKFESGTGWPSFYNSFQEGHVAAEADNTFFMKRTEVLCSRCNAHLGHVFNDGPKPTGLRYCINSVSLAFKKESEDRSQDSGIRNQ